MFSTCLITPVSLCLSVPAAEVEPALWRRRSRPAEREVVVVCLRRDGVVLLLLLGTCHTCGSDTGGRERERENVCSVYVNKTTIGRLTDCLTGRNCLPACLPACLTLEVCFDHLDRALVDVVVLVVLQLFDVGQRVALLDDVRDRVRLETLTHTHTHTRARRKRALGKLRQGESNEGNRV